uniref:Potassium channel tetramerisation-type BTB domain-containing protein n=1 Tax=Arcella intermedia TaxID=1963864 RepID=A0A6B2LF27_9EUKA
MNVGGRCFETTLPTLRRYPSSWLASQFSGSPRAPFIFDDSGRVFLDRDGEAFSYVLEYLRSPDTWILPSDTYLKEKVFNELRHLEIPLPETYTLVYTKTDVVNRFPTSTTFWSYGNGVDAIQFSISKKAYLMAVGLYGGSNEAEIKIYRGTVVLSHIPRTPCNQKVTIFYFVQPVELERGEDYVVVCKVSGGTTSYGSNGRELVVVGDMHVRFSTIEPSKVCSGYSNNGTSCGSGQIPQLIFGVTL